jgi:hypothetical protein
MKFGPLDLGRLALLIIGVVSASHTAADERIWLKHAEVNGKSVKLVFDSGSAYNFLSPDAFKKLGLRFVPAETNNTPGLWAGDTELCTISLKGTKSETTFVVLDLPGYARAKTDFDGGIGWSSMSKNVLSIDAISHTLTALPKVTPQVLQWPRFFVSTNLGTLDLRVPQGKDKEGMLCIDTGTDGGVSLPNAQWREWTNTHPHATTTLKTFYSPMEGFQVQTEAWVARISFGPITLTDVPVSSEGPVKASVLGTNYQGTLGLSALKRFELVVDGEGGVAYLQPRKTPPLPYDHNRLGAVFVPTEIHTNQGVACVVAGSPAYEAGVRDGDILLQVDGIACKSWSESWLSHFHRPAGTKLKLTLERDGKTFKTTATLRDILHPGAEKRE